MLQTKSGKQVSKIGIGTWTISKDKIKEEVDALNFYFASGVNFINVVLSYDNGNTLDVVAEFLKNIKREDIFINAFITHGCKKIEDIEKQVNTYLEKLNTDYLDCVSLHGLPCLGFEFDEYMKEIERLKKSKKFLNVGVANIMPTQLDKYINKIDYFEGLYNLENKINEDTGIINTCLKNGIPFYAFQPLRRNRTAKQNYKEVVALAKKYYKTQNQILINWMILHKKIGLLIKSSNIEHISENLESLDFEMQAEDYKILDRFRNAEFDKLNVSYKIEDGKVNIASIPNQPIGKL